MTLASELERIKDTLSLYINIEDFSHNITVSNQDCINYLLYFDVEHSIAYYPSSYQFYDKLNKFRAVDYVKVKVDDSTIPTIINALYKSNKYTKKIISNIKKYQLSQDFSK